MSNDALVGFTDNSDNESGFKIKFDDKLQASVYHQGNGNVTEDCRLINNPSADMTTTSEDYEVVCNDADHGSHQVRCQRDFPREAVLAAKLAMTLKFDVFIIFDAVKNMQQT